MEREARRKNIARREGDRMALITGRIPKSDTSNEPFSSPDEEDKGASRDRVCGKLDREEVTALTLQRSVQPDEAQHPYKPFEYHLSSITPKEINISIISSENTRAVCSLMTGILVVLSHLNLPHSVVGSKSLIAYRPLYALLLTDVLIVAARLALYSEGKGDDEEEMKFEGLGGNNNNNNNNNEKKKKNMEDNNWEGAVKLLEWGLVLHQGVRAVFIDCSFYVTVVVCGLALV